MIFSPAFHPVFHAYPILMRPKRIDVPLTSCPAHTSRPLCQVDIWAVGVLVYELLVGRPPFEVDEAKETARLILSATVSHWPATLSPQAVAFMKAALAKAPGDRPHAGELLRHGWVRQHVSERDMPSSPARTLKEMLDASRYAWRDAWRGVWQGVGKLSGYLAGWVCDRVLAICMQQLRSSGPMMIHRQDKTSTVPHGVTSTALVLRWPAQCPEWLPGHQPRRIRVTPQYVGKQAV